MANKRELTHNGITKTHVQWAEDRGIPLRTLKMRIAKGWSVRDCLYGRPGRSRVVNPPIRTLTYLGETLTLKEWSDRVGLPKATLLSRIKREWTPAQVLNGKTEDQKVKPRGRHNSTFVTWKGERRTLKEWATALHMPYETIFSRHYRGCTDPERLFRPTDTRYSKGRNGSQFAR